MAITLIRCLAITHPVKHRTFIRKYTKKMCLLICVFLSVIVTCLYFSLYFTLDHAKFDQYEVIIFPIMVYPASIAFACSYYHLRNLLTRKEVKFNQKKFPELSCSSVKILKIKVRNSHLKKKSIYICSQNNFCFYNMLDTFSYIFFDKDF